MNDFLPAAFLSFLYEIRIGELRTGHCHHVCGAALQNYLRFVEPGDAADKEELITMISTDIKEGETIYHRQPGGGGFGDPLERDPKAVARDVRNDRVSREAAAAECR